MTSSEFKGKIGDAVIAKCQNALLRIREGIQLLIDDEIAFNAFCFMNRAMILQRNITNYSKCYGSGIECSFQDFIDPRKEENNFGWRPFQIAFILMNLNAIVDPLHSDRNIVDLLYFPTGGGKTEAYLGLMAFVIANRRLRAKADDSYNRDGGVTAILRYTLRLLTTQLRDRITKMVLAAEMIRDKCPEQYGHEPISIGFWVGGGVTPNSFDDLKEDPEDIEKTEKARRQKNLLYKQLLNCPFCGKPLTEKEFYIDTDTKSVTIYCGDENCQFYKYRPEKHKIPVYMVDEEIYAKCPTIILSTVDKFASLPWSVSVNSIFGRVDRKCSRDGYVAIGEKHSVHKSTDTLPTSRLEKIKPFLPPELIIQDELHLITGPLGTIYGAYETVIEDLCTYSVDETTIRPKYVVSTATIKNAGEQTRCLYGRKQTVQFPPSGFEIGDSFFIKEIPIEKDPFRKYVGVCAPGQSVKTTLLRIYSILLQESYALSLEDPDKQYIDPYYSLVGYYNSIRELGGAVRLLQDDIPTRINRIKKKYGMSKVRYLNRRVEITSRMSSYDIPKKLKQLEIKYDSKDCLDTAVATNMIAVGMDVDRLGLMVVTGQPKQNSEYIQATSRIGRSFPGLVVSLYNPYRPRDLSHYENFTGYHLLHHFRIFFVYQIAPRHSFLSPCFRINVKKSVFQEPGVVVLLTEIMTVPIQAVNLESDQIDIGSCRIGDLDRIKALINIVEDYLVFQKKISSKEIGFVLLAGSHIVKHKLLQAVRFCIIAVKLIVSQFVCHHDSVHSFRVLAVEENKAISLDDAVHAFQLFQFITENHMYTKSLRYAERIGCIKSTDQFFRAFRDIGIVAHHHTSLSTMDSIIFTVR